MRNAFFGLVLFLVGLYVLVQVGTFYSSMGRCTEGDWWSLCAYFVLHYAPLAISGAVTLFVGGRLLWRAKLR